MKKVVNNTRINKNKKRVVAFDFIRCFATICIITFHFLIAGKQIYPTEYFFINYDLAQVGVSLFFILSGAALYYNNRDSFSYKTYYKKRFMAIFPLFYVAYIGIFLFAFWKEGNIISGIPLRNLIFSVIGMDGLLSYKIPCMSMTGEWFLGAIIILYIIYPFIRKCVLKQPLVTILVGSILYIMLYYNYPFEMPILYNPLIRSIEFIFGMVYIELMSRKSEECYTKVNIINLILCLIIAILMLYIKLPIPQMFEITIGGCALFVVMLEIGKKIKNKKFIEILKLGTKYSFAIFLVHHYIANIIQFHFIGHTLSWLENILAYIIYLILISLFAKLLLWVTNNIISKIKYLVEKES